MANDHRSALPLFASRGTTVVQLSTLIPTIKSSNPTIVICHFVILSFQNDLLTSKHDRFNAKNVWWWFLGKRHPGGHTLELPPQEHSTPGVKITKLCFLRRWLSRTNELNCLALSNQFNQVKYFWKARAYLSIRWGWKGFRGTNGVA